MATKLFSRLPDVRGVPTAGQSNTVRVNIPAVGRLLNLKGNVLQNGAPAPLDAMKNAIGECRLIINTKVDRKWRFSEYLAVLEANNYLNEDGFFPYYLAEPWRAQVWDEEMLSLQMGGRYESVALEFDVTQPAVPLAFDFAYEYDMLPKVDTAGKAVYGILGHTVQVEKNGGGESQILLNKFDGALQRLFLVVPSATDINRVKLLQKDTTLYDRWNTAARPEIARSLKDMGMQMPADFTNANGTFKIVPVIFDNNQRISNSIADKSELGLNLDLSEDSQIRILIEHQLMR